MSDASPAAFTWLHNGLELTAGTTTARVTALRDDVLRVRLGRDGRLGEDASWAVLPQARTAAVAVTPLAAGAGAGFRTAALEVRIESDPFRLTVRDLQGRVVCADAADGGIELRGRGFTLRKALTDGARVFGLGDKAGPLDRRGQAFSLWNTDAYGFQESTDPLYKAIPFYLCAQADGLSHGVLLDTTWRSAFDVGRLDPETLSFGAVAGPIDYYLLAGPEPKAVLEAYAWLTGPSPLPPRWSLGFQQCRWSYLDEAEVRGVAKRLRAERIPADALYLDIDFQDRNRPFTVDAAAFPDLPGLIADLAAMDLKVVLITDLHIARAPDQAYAPYDSGVAGDHFVKAAGGGDVIGPVWPGPSVFPDFTRRETRTWWGGLYADFQAMGAAGYWNDMNEPAVFETPTKTLPLDAVHRIEEPGFKPRTAPHAEIHNLYGMQNSRATREGLLALRPDARPFVLTRASFAGGQRYAATWTGDNSSTWNHLRLSTAMLLNLGLSGFAHAGADVGGFVGAPSAELLTRWIQVGAFTPLFRDHTAKGTPPQEPWVHGPEHTALRRAAIEERYRLLPYLYALAEETARTGVPMMRPVFLEFPETLAGPGDPGAAFLLGPSLLVAPQPFGEMTDAYDVILPGEGWWDYATGRVVTAARRLDDPMAPDAPVVRETPRLDRLPVFVRPGTILPRQPLVQSTAETPDGPLELRVYPGADGETTLYWDDGASLNGATLRQTVSLTTTTEGLTLSFAAREGAYPPWWREIELVVFGWDRPAAAVRLDGVEVAATAETAAGVVRVRLPDQAGPAVLRVA